MATFHTVGMVRNIDPLGRIVIPKEFRRVLGWNPGDAVEILASKDGEVLLRKYEEKSAEITEVK